MIPRNVSSVGSLMRASSRDGIVIFVGGQMPPGGGLRSEVTIVNLGVLPAVFHLREVDASSGFAAGILGLAIHELRGSGSGRIYLGELGEVPDHGIDLGLFEAGESRTYRFTAFLAKDTPDDELTRSASASYRWTAVSGDLQQ
jgi:hypothetical protein